MADSTVTIGGDISDLQAKLKQAGAGVKSFGAQARGSLQGIDLGKAFAVAGGVAGLTSLVKVGFEFNQAMKDSEVAIANVVKKFQGLNDTAARDEARKAMAAIVEMEPKSAASLQGLTEGFLATFAAAQSAGVSVEKNVELVGMMANALANANIPAEQLTQELRSIFQGNITSDSALAKMLQINNADVAKAKEAGQLYEMLVEKIGSLGVAGDTAGVAFSTLDSAVKKVLGALTAGLFDEAVGGAKELSTYLDQNKELFMDMGAGIGFAAKEMVKFLAFLNESRKVLQEISGIETILNGLDGRNAAAEAALSSLPGVAQARAAAEAALAPKPAPGSVSAPQQGMSSPVAEQSAQSILSITREIETVEKMRLQLGERQFANLLRHLTPQLQIEAIEKRITQEKQKQQQQIEAGPRSESAELSNLETLLDLEEQLAQAKQARADAAAAAAEKELQANERLLDQAQALADLQATTELLKAQAAGDDKKAAALQRQADIQRAVKDIVDATGLSEAEALRLAEEQQRLKEQIAAANPEGGTNRDRPGRIDASIEGGADAARQRAEERLRRSRERSDQAVKEGFGTLGGEDARLKERFANEFGPPAQRQNPAQLDAGRNAAAAGAGAAGSPQDPAAQTVIQLVSQILEAVK